VLIFCINLDASLPFVVLISLTPIRRRLLGEIPAEETSETCPGGGLQYFSDPNNNGEVIVSDAVVCAAGNSMLVFDIGYVGSDGSFVAVALSVMSASIIVAPGKSVAMRFLSTNSTKELSFARLSTLLYLRFLDQGYNVRLPTFSRFKQIV
jgi:hypothetical protein